MTKTLKKLIHYCWLFVAYFTIGAAVLVSTIRMLAPHAAEYSNEIKSFVQENTNYLINFEHIHFTWHRLSPVIEINQISFVEQNNTKNQASAKYLALKLNLWQMLREQKLVIKSIVASGLKVPTIDLNQAQQKQISERVKSLFNNLYSISVEDSVLNVLDQENKIQTVDLITGKLINAASRRHIDLHISGSYLYSSDLKIKSDLKGDLFSLDTWHLSAYADIIKLPLIRINNIAGNSPIHFVEGSVSSHVWFEWRNNRFTRASGNLEVSDVVMRDPQRKRTTVSLLNAKTNFAYKEKTQNSWSILGDSLILNLKNKSTSPSQFNIQYQQNKNPQFIIRTEELQIDGIPELLTTIFPFNPKLKSNLMQLKLNGGIRDAIIKLNNKGNDWDYSGQFNLSKINTEELNDIPPIHGIDGSVQFDNNSATISLNSENLTIDYRSYFREKWYFQKAFAKLSLIKNPANWLLKIDKLDLENSYSGLKGTGTLLLPINQDQPTINLQASGFVSDSKFAHHYLPIRHFNPGLRSWLDSAFSVGRVDNIKVNISGPVSDFPFKNNEGLFEISFDTKNLDLNYTDGWPIINNLSAHANFKNTFMSIDAKQGVLSGANIKHVKAIIPNLADKNGAILYINGQLTGNLINGKQYIMNSPLNKKLGEKVSAFNFNGPMDVDLELNIPLGNINKKITVNGKLKTHEATIKLIPANIEFEQVTGEFNFTEYDISSKQIEAKLWDMPVIFSLQNKNKNALTWTETSGHIEADSEIIKQKYPSELWKYLKGKSSVNFSFRDYIDKTKQKTLTFTSPLIGLNIELPEPIGKAAQENKSLQLKLSFLENKQMYYQLNLEKQLSGAFLVKSHDNGDLYLDRGQIKIGTTVPISNLSEDGLIINGNINSLDSNRWISLFDKTDNKNSFYSYDNKPFKLQLDFKKFIVMNTQLINGQIEIGRQKNKWQFNINSQNNIGQIDLPDQKNQLIFANFKKCSYQPLKQNEQTSDEKVKPSYFRSIDFQCREATYKKSKLGEIKLLLNSDAKQLILKQLDIKGRHYQANITGNWQQHKNGKDYTKLSGKVLFQDINDLQQIFKLNTEIADSSGQFSFNFYGPWSFFDFQSRGLNGDIAIDLKEGRLVDVNAGVGRVISLFSFNNLARRLRLDFSDVFKEGFSFDHLQGDFQIDKGVAQTNNLIIKAPTAYMSINGRTDLIHQFLDLEILVMPKVSSTLPVAAAIASGNPIIGAMVWAVDKILLPKLDNVTQYKYQVTGSWDKPNIYSVRK